MVMRSCLILLCLGLLVIQQARGAEYIASVDRQELLADESLTLTLSLINSETRLRAEGISPNVDLSVLTPDFDLDTPRADSRYNIYRGRGRSSSEISVRLFPRRTGQLVIPGFSIDGLRTAPITVRVHALPAGTRPEAYTRSGISKTAAWVREQFVVWLDVYHRSELKSAKLGGYIESEPVRIELLEHRQLPESKRTETVDGIEYQVERLAWAIAPNLSGRLQIYLPDVWLLTQDDRELRLAHRQESIEIRALPASVADDVPVGKLTLTQTTPDSTRENTASSWTITVRGPVSRFAFPEQLDLDPLPTDIRLFIEPGQRTVEDSASGFTTAMSYTLTAIPQHSGTYSMPPVRIPYFDPDAGEIMLAELEGNVLEVAAPTLITETAPVAASSHAAASQMPDANTRANSIWFMVSMVLAILWVSTLMLWWSGFTPVPRKLKSQVHSTHMPAQATVNHPLQSMLLEAFGSRTLEQGLSEWEMRHGINEEIRAAVRLVQRACYGPDRNEGNENLSQIVSDACKSVRSARVTSATTPADPWAPEAFTSHLAPSGKKQG